MVMEDGGGASSSAVVQAQPVASAMAGYAARVQPPPFWSTPTPYLFIGFAVVMALIAVALAVLLCSRRKDEDGGADHQASAAVMALHVLAPLDREDAAAAPKVLVVMAGHSAPSFLASAAPLAGGFDAAANGADGKPRHQLGSGGGGKGDGAAAV
ncbi:hypothetical protein U9M48_025394 [Paspalum notatum var. saurae]|uniref:Uncharacterized protein n=1 Tax=Paspalum notatum var. saurae TaxID=547442 RepID=A0AAQ3TQC8_PASNO